MIQEIIENNGDQKSILILEVGWEQFAIDLLDVKEIIQAGRIRRLPNSLDFIDGIYNYRGEIIHIINLKKKLNLNKYLLYNSKIDSTHENNSKNFIVILNLNNNYIGFFVGKIINIIDIDKEEIVKLSPIFKTSVAMKYIKGILKFDDRPRILLNIGKIFTEVEQLLIQKKVSI